jgi:hypothetical protein
MRMYRTTRRSVPAASGGTDPTTRPCPREVLRHRSDETDRVAFETRTTLSDGFRPPSSGRRVQAPVVRKFPSGNGTRRVDQNQRMPQR